MSDAAAGPTSSAAALPQLTAAHITCSRGMAGWLAANRVSLAFTSYQTGRLYLVGVDDAGGLAIYEVGTGRAMGLWADPQRLVLATVFQSGVSKTSSPPATSCNGSVSRARRPSFAGRAAADGGLLHRPGDQRADDF